MPGMSDTLGILAAPTAAERVDDVHRFFGVMTCVTSSPPAAEVGVERFDPPAAGLQSRERLPHLVPPQERERVGVGLRHLAVRIELRAELGRVGGRLPVLRVADTRRPPARAGSGALRPAARAGSASWRAWSSFVRMPVCACVTASNAARTSSGGAR